MSNIETLTVVICGTHADVNTLNEAIHDAVLKTVWKQTRRRPMVIPVVTET